MKNKNHLKRFLAYAIVLSLALTSNITAFAAECDVELPVEDSSTPIAILSDYGPIITNGSVYWSQNSYPTYVMVEFTVDAYKSVTFRANSRSSNSGYYTVYLQKKGAFGIWGSAIDTQTFAQGPDGVYGPQSSAAWYSLSAGTYRLVLKSSPNPQGTDLSSVNMYITG